MDFVSENRFADGKRVIEKKVKAGMPTINLAVTDIFTKHWNIGISKRIITAIEVVYPRLQA